VPPGAVTGRGGAVSPFHGHMESSRLCPTRGAELGSPSLPKNGYVARSLVSKRRGSSCCGPPDCHRAHKRSTLACSKKNKGSLGPYLGQRESPGNCHAHDCGG
jgi:hypothetical protein